MRLSSHHCSLRRAADIVRTGLMNCTYPLTESILMDTVPRGQRARWKSLESITAFGWCGSAVIGGALADKYDYAFTFLITAGLQAAGLSLFLLIRHVVPTEKKLDKADSKAGSKKVTASPGAPEEALPSEREDAPLLVNE
mmetsp:Transcript_9598/g.29064  ORF Transcript_9598/g.29064 Transcript_9598/m.29064 type:complete len:140 (+) Transcript_9598:1167-1586(+)